MMMTPRKTKASRRLVLGGAAALAAAALVTAVHVARAGGPVSAVHLATGYAAQEGCSCAFVVEQPDDYCIAYGTQAGLAVDIAIDHNAKTVTASYLGVTGVSRYADGAGCTLDGP